MPQLEDPSSFGDVSSKITINETYSSLRQEILKRIDIRYQLVNLAVVASGTILGLGWEQKSSLILFVFPILGTGLALGWQDNHNWLKLIGSYLANTTNSDWENALRYNNPLRTSRIRNWLGSFSTVGVFLGTEFMSWFAGLYLLNQNVDSPDFLKVSVAIIGGMCIASTGSTFVLNRKDVEFIPPIISHSGNT